MSKKMKIYVASSWRNDHQQFVVQRLREEGFEVYDFKNPAPGNSGFHWSEIDPKWKEWDAPTFRDALDHSVAVEGFGLDFAAMEGADVCVLLLPSGRSAHLEGGYFAGHPDKRLFVLLGVNEERPIPKQEPELMYRMADSICLNIEEAVKALQLMYRMADSICLNIEEAVKALLVYELTSREQRGA